MCRCRPTKAQYRPISGCHMKGRFTVGLLMATIFPKNEIPHKLLCDIFQDGGLTSHKKPQNDVSRMKLIHEFSFHYWLQP